MKKRSPIAGECVANPARDGEVKVKNRKKGSQNDQLEKSNFLSALGIDLGSLEVSITLNKDDKEMLQNTLKEISDKVDYRWKFTQILMIIAMVGTIGIKIIEWGYM